MHNQLYRILWLLRYESSPHRNVEEVIGKKICVTITTNPWAAGAGLTSAAVRQAVRQAKDLGLVAEVAIGYGWLSVNFFSS